MVSAIVDEVKRKFLSQTARKQNQSVMFFRDPFALVPVNEIATIADIYRANIVDVSKESVIVSLTGSQSKINAFIELLDGFTIVEIARTGITGLERGPKGL